MNIKTNRRKFLKTTAAAAIGIPTLIPASAPGENATVAPSNRIVVGGKEMLDYKISLDTIYNKITEDYCWVHTRGGVIPGNPPLVVATTQQWAMGKSDIFSEVFHLKTEDMGETWSDPIKNTNLGSKKTAEGLEIGISGLYPAYHKVSGKLLATGLTVTYDGGIHPASVDKSHRILPIYTIYNEDSDTWTDWKTVDLGDDEKFHRCNWDSCQRIDLVDGSFLMPLSYSEKVVNIPKRQ
jgi:hypothetical protein